MSYNLSSIHDRDLSSVSSVRSFSGSVDVILFVPNIDNTDTLRKRVNERALQRTTNCSKGCVTCPFINKEPVAVSNSTGAAFGMANHATHDCNTKGLIYLIECKQCHYQYVGLTKQTLRKRLSGHRHLISNDGQTLLARHFRAPGHSISDLTIRVLQHVGGDKVKLHDT